MTTQNVSSFKIKFLFLKIRFFSLNTVFRLEIWWMKGWNKLQMKYKRMIYIFCADVSESFLAIERYSQSCILISFCVHVETMIHVCLFCRPLGCTYRVSTSEKRRWENLQMCKRLAACNRALSEEIQSVTTIYSRRIVPRLSKRHSFISGADFKSIGTINRPVRWARLLGW